MTAWVFGREFVDRTAKELLAVPTPRAATVGAKFVVVGCWATGLIVLVFGLGLLVGWAVDIPGWSPGLLARAAGNIAVTALLTFALMSPVALVASAGRGYLPAHGMGDPDAGPGPDSGDDGLGFLVSLGGAHAVQCTDRAPRQSDRPA